MTVTEGDHREDNVHHPASIACEEVGCCGDDHSEDHVADEVESHCGGGCCGDDEHSDCDSDVDHCDDSCCGPCEDQDVHEEPTCGTGGCCAAGSPDSESVHSSCCIPAIGGDEEVYTPGKCIPDGVNGCQRAALLKSTCCGSHANSVPGTPSEVDDPGVLTDSSDAILLKELKSIIQEHSTTHHHHTNTHSGLRKRTTRHNHGHTHDDDAHDQHSGHSHSRQRVTSVTSVACSVVNSLFARVLQRLAVFAKGECCCVANQTVVPIPTCSTSHNHSRSHSHDRTRDHHHDHKPNSSHEVPPHIKGPSSVKLPEITQTSIDLAERGAGADRRKMIMSIEGMDCPSCAVRVTKALNKIPSVTQPKVNSFAAEATLMYDIGSISPEEIAQRVTVLTGFTCKFEQELREEDLLKTLWVSVPVKWDDHELPIGVSIKSRRLTKNKGNLLEVQYDSTLIQPRNVVAGFEPWDGEYIPLEQIREPSQASKDMWLLLRRTILSTVATIPILVFAWAPLPKRPVLYGSISLVLATFVQFYIALPLYRSSFRSLFLQHVLDMDLLVAGSTSIAYTYSIVSFAFLAAGKPIDESFFETSALLVTLIMVGRTVSAIARRRTTSALDTVDALQVRMVNLVESGGVRSIPAELVHVGDILQVSPDSTIPTDGVIRNGVTQVDESSLTGESKPVEKQRGSSVIAGTLNLSGSIEITASRSLSENTIAGISRLMHDAQESRIPIQDLADRVAAYFAPVVLVLGLVTFLTWIFVGKYVQDRTTEKASVQALMKMIAVLVVSCPCAVSLCVPMVVVIAVSVAAKKGILFKSIESVQYARDTTAVLFDKTGTLTEGNLSVVEYHAFTEDAALLTYHLTKTSTHPVAKAVTKHVHSLASPASPPKLGAITSVAGQGLETKLGQRTLRGGNCRWLNLGEHPNVRELRQKSRTIFALTLDGEPVAIFGLVDKLRPGAEALVRSLARRGVDVYVLSGDEPTVVESVAAQLGIPPDHAVGGCTPKSKAEFVRNIQENRQPGSARRSKRAANVMFIGDGTNDIVALTQADTGVSVSSGTDVAISAADVIMLNPANIHQSVETIFKVSESSFRRIAWNFAWSFLYNLFAILLAGGAFVKFSIQPAYAGLGEMVSILPVILVAWTMVLV